MFRRNVALQYLALELSCFMAPSNLRLNIPTSDHVNDIKVQGTQPSSPPSTMVKKLMCRVEAPKEPQEPQGDLVSMYACSTYIEALLGGWRHIEGRLHNALGISTVQVPTVSLLLPSQACPPVSTGRW